VLLGLSLERISTIVKTEGYRVIHQEIGKAINDDITWSCEGVMEVILHDNIFACLYIHLVARTLEREVGKKALAVLTDRGMAHGYISEMGIQCISEPDKREP